jgi:uncharacterized protein (TIGR02145 family)
MNYKRLSHILFVFLLLSTFSCNSEKKKYTELLEKQDLVLAYEFKTKFPDSSQKIDSLIQVLEYKKVCNSQSISELTKYVERFPNNVYNDSIINILYQLERQILQKNWSVKAVNIYIEKYPNSPYTSELENWLFGNSSSGTFVDGRDGTKYKWRKIGNQIWMTENLKAIKYNDGIGIPLVVDNKAWEGLSTPAYCYYSGVYDQRNEDILYNYGVVMTDKICPLGWNVPSREEWKTLIFSFGSWFEAGDKLKIASDVTHGTARLNATNSSGFSANMGGWRTEFGVFSGADKTGAWWGTIDNTNWSYWMYFDSPEVRENIDDKRRGFSIRCIKASDSNNNIEADNTDLSNKNVGGMTISSEKIPPAGLYALKSGRGEIIALINVIIENGKVKFQTGENKNSLVDEDIELSETGGMYFSIYGSSKYIGDGVIENSGSFFNGNSGGRVKFIKMTL